MRAACIVLLALAGCNAAGSVPSERAGRLFVSKAGDITFEVPQNWQEEAMGPATVVAGPKNTDDYFTTLTLQARDGTLGSLEDALRAAYHDNPNLEEVEFFEQLPTFIADELALLYFVRFVVYEQPRLRVGVLFASDSGVLDLTYTAPEPLFASNVDVWEQALATLALGAGSADEL